MGKSLFSMQVAASLLLVICMLASSLHGASAQDCSTTQLAINLTPCLPYIQPGNTTTPGTACCTGLAKVIDANATCLCEVADLGEQSFSVNETRALEIAGQCNQTVPNSVKTCLTSNAPAGTPTNTTTPSTSSPSNNNDGSILSPSSLLTGSILVVFSLYLSVHV